MKLHFACICLIFVSALASRESKTVTDINKPATSSVSGGLPQPDSKTQAQIRASYGELPLSFEANQGQTDAQVKFFSRGSGYTLFLTGDEALLSLTREEARIKPNDEALPASLQLRSTVFLTTRSVLRMKLVRASPAAKVTGEDQLPGLSNYFIGNDPKKWRRNVPNYAKVKYERIYPGIDLVYYGNQRHLEYEFLVGPAADPHRIEFEVRGARRITRGPDGELVLQTAVGEVRWSNPIVYQEQGGTRQQIAAQYVIKHKSRVGFEIGDYDLGRPLFIDPLIYSTFLGGSGNDQGFGVAVDGSGNAYVTGETNSTNFPTTNPLQPANAGGVDAFVTKLNPTGSALVYSTYLGGSGFDQGEGIAVDSSGNAYVVGATNSNNFPVTPNAFQSACGNPSSCANAFVTKLNPTGSALVYSTYLGGNLIDSGLGIAVDASGSAYVVGETSSTNFPTLNPLQPVYGGGNDAFVSKLNAAGSALVYSTYLGGSADDAGNGIAVDSSGDAYVTGVTFSTNFPTMGPFQANLNGTDNAFVSELNPSGSALVYSTYLGGNGTFGAGVVVDNSDNAYVVGGTSSTNFPVTTGSFQTACGNPSSCENAFVTKLNSTGSALVYSTYLGGLSATGSGVALDSSGDAYVTGITSTNFPTKNPVQPSNASDADAFVSELNPSGSALVYSTYLGGSGYDQGFGIAVDSSGNAYVVGETSSTNFPTMNPLQTAYAGGLYDAFVSKIIGQDFSVVANSPTTVTVMPGQVANYHVYVSAISGFNQSVMLTCSGAPAQSTCIVTPSSIAPGPTANVAVATTASSAGVTQPAGGSAANNAFGLWAVFSGTLVLTLLIRMVTSRYVWRPQVLCGLTFLCLLSIGITVTACGGGSNGNGGGGTQAGTYALTVTGTYTSGPVTLTNNTKLVLVVQ
jgi:Beta-propeller repeat